MRQIEPGLDKLIPVCLELPLRCGLLDNLYATPDGDLVIVEVKLWKNHEMRRSVMAQVLDYASAMFDLSYEQLDDAVKSAERSGGRSLVGSVTSCLEIRARNAFLAPPGPHRSEGVAGTEMRAGRRKKHWRRNRDITEKAYPFCSDSISILWSWLALSPLFV